VKETLHVNYYGTLEATRVFLPLIKDGGRLVNVSSAAGSLGRYMPGIQSRFRNAKTVEDVTKLMEEFTAAVAEGKETEKGWPSNAYGLSKAGATGMTKVIAEIEKEKGSKVLINACCPGWVKVRLPVFMYYVLLFEEVLSDESGLLMKSFTDGYVETPWCEDTRRGCSNPGLACSQ
jgi:NAD(P)-dependent dehydrogenase (short-subunit alcohol dehydrogenase family)